jgi:formate hydrogenlyase subunit 3/multisubunit Na+/H+ antiporter MnhD subunit
MALTLLGLAVILAGALAALLLDRRPKWASFTGAGAALLGCAAVFGDAFRMLLTGDAVSLRLPWNMPLGSFFVELDPLSAFFLLPISALAGLAALYGAEYLQAWAGRKSLGAAWFWYNLLAAAMVLVVISRNGLLFLMAWETMALASFFLVAFENEKEQVREAAWTYFIATQLGTAFVVALFAILATETGTLDFDGFSGIGGALPGLLFVLAVIGFGAKAGFVPLHVWLPEAHPAAPSHVSAVMSGVMIKTGLYALLRMMTLLGEPQPWWGWTLVGIGLTSGVLGILFALAQHDLKRLLAYSSVENVGIITLGLGIGVLALTARAPVPAALAFAGALLHVINHAAFKGLLFLGAGAVAHATGTREMDRLGGLLKRMPWTGAAFLIGAAAICGLPPLNGFASELLIGLAALLGGTSAAGSLSTAGFLSIAGLALIGGLALATFTKAFGMVFLGEARTPEALRAHEPGMAMRFPIALLAGACIVIGLFAPIAALLLTRAVAALLPVGEGAVDLYLFAGASSLRWAVLVGGTFVALAGLLAALRMGLLGGRKVSEQGTWDCGYARPTPRMQYTASSFAQPLVDLFRMALGTRRQFTPPQGLLPGNAAAFRTATRDTFTHKLFRPAFDGASRALGRVRGLQHGRLQLYVLYVALTLIALLVWRLGGGKP